MMKQNKKIYLKSLLDIRPRKMIHLITDNVYCRIEIPLWQKFEMFLEYNVGTEIDSQVKRDLKVLG